LEKNEIYIHYTVRYGSPVPAFLVALGGILKWVFGLGTIVTVGFALIKPYFHMKIEELRLERAKVLEGSLDDLLKLYEEGKITEEMFLKSVEALKHGHSVADAATPPHPLWEAFTKWAPVIVVLAIVGLVIYIIYRVVAR